MKTLDLDDAWGPDWDQEEGDGLLVEFLRC
jgi:hypothetical protein